MLWPVSEYIRSARVLSTCALYVLPVDQEYPTIHYLTSLIQQQKELWANCPSRDRSRSSNTSLNVDPSDESHHNFLSSVRLQCTLVIPSLQPPWQGIPIKDFSTPHCIDLSLSSINISLIINQRNNGLASTSSVPYHYQSYQHQASCLKDWIYLKAPLRSEDNDVIKKDSYQPALITTIL